MAKQRKAKRGKDAERAELIVQRLAEAYPDARCELKFRSPFQLLIATILSAQCTDERVNSLTPALFRKYRSARDFAEADSKELEQDIKPTGFFRSKARSIQACCRELVERHSGKVPTDLDEMVKLTGIGRKTANMVLGAALGKATGIVVDTHVRRVAARLGLTRQTDPDKIEQDLIKLVPQDQWVPFSFRLIHHGRYCCTARNPQCEQCKLVELCPKIGLAAEGKRAKRKAGSRAK